jgi:hypothetical protein
MSGLCDLAEKSCDRKSKQMFSTFGYGDTNSDILASHLSGSRFTHICFVLFTKKNCFEFCKMMVEVVSFDRKPKQMFLFCNTWLGGTNANFEGNSREYKNVQNCLMLMDLLTPKVLAKNIVSDFGYPRACIFQNVI